MKILVTIAHYYNTDGICYSRGASNPNPESKIKALTECLTSLNALANNYDFVPASENTSKIARMNESLANQVDVTICVNGNSHLLKWLKVPVSYYKIINRDISPLHLTYLCQNVLRDALPKGYDYYCYVDDDIIIKDPYFFQKLQWFTTQLGNDNLLMPSLYELSDNESFPCKFYLENADRSKGSPFSFQDWSVSPEITYHNFLGMPLKFVKPSNYYSASFFLNAEQMRRSVNSPYFLQGEGSPNENPTLEKGLMSSIERTFQIYKPAVENAAFFEVQHAGNFYLQLHMNSFFAKGNFSDIS